MKLIKLPVYHLPGNDDLRAIEVVGKQSFGGVLYYVRRIIYADIREKRGPDFIIEPGEEGQRESESGWATGSQSGRKSDSQRVWVGLCACSPPALHLSAVF